jgi:NADPH2:quinone reductase
MKALLCPAYGPLDGLVLGEAPVPVPGPGQLRVAVHAAALNFLDALMVQGRYQVRPTLPFVPGAEFAGVVDAVGAGVTRFRAGDRVACFGLGGYAEYALADAASAVPVPASMPFDDAAALFLAHGTALRALDTSARTQAGETVLVLGAAGGVGAAAIEVAKAMGATVIAAASSAPKLELCRVLGADHLVDYSHEKLRERCEVLTGGRGVDVAYDPVGGEFTEQAVRALGWRGRLVVVGFAAGAIPSIPANLLLFKERSLVGVYWGESVAREPDAHARDAARLAAWYADGKIRSPVRERVPLAGAADAIRRMAARGTVGKVVVEPRA